jgi:hypothetical protein
VFWFDHEAVNSDRATVGPPSSSAAAWNQFSKHLLALDASLAARENESSPDASNSTEGAGRSLSEATDEYFDEIGVGPAVIFNN